ncbi:MAG TPA: FAD binding domain-containing protein [Azospirillum sp.]|nr:FAD binding domain-containing protein [Azospirillum sp.]
MKPAAFEYCRPDTVAEAVALLTEFDGEASVLSGGMSLGPMLNMRLVRPQAVVDIKHLRSLEGIEVRSGEVWTGGLVRQADALKSETLARTVPLLALALPFVGHFQTRNRGTLGGSVAHADPSAELPLCLATLGGQVELGGRRRRRRVAARDFFLGTFTTSREPAELLTGLLWPRREPRTGYAFDEMAHRHGDFAIVAVAAAATVTPDGRVERLSVGLGGVEDRPMVGDTGAFLGHPATPDTATAVAEALAERCDPMTDMKASADYRRALVRELTGRTVARAFDQARREP